MLHLPLTVDGKKCSVVFVVFTLQATSGGVGALFRQLCMMSARLLGEPLSFDGQTGALATSPAKAQWGQSPSSLPERVAGGQTRSADSLLTG